MEGKTKKYIRNDRRKDERWRKNKEIQKKKQRNTEDERWREKQRNT